MEVFLLLVMVLLRLADGLTLVGRVLGAATGSTAPAPARAVAGRLQTCDFFALLLALQTQSFDQSFRVVQPSLHLDLLTLEHAAYLDRDIQRLLLFFGLFGKF